MAQTLELPQVDQTPAPPANTDDLLSQLAGEELDKLLAEAEVEKQSSPAPVAEPTSAPKTLTEVAVPAAPVPSEASAAPKPSAKAAASAEADAAINAELDQLFKELNGDTATPAAESSDATFDAIPEADPEPAAPAETAAAATASPASITTDQFTTQQEQAALKAEIAADVHADGDEPESLPIYLKPLQWLSMPLQLVPEPGRELVGRVAIITFMNAVSVIAYLLIFRRH